MRPVAVVVGLRCVRRAWSQVDGGTRVLRPTLAGGLRGPPPWPHQHRMCHALARATANGACARGHHRRPAGNRGGLPSRRPRWLWGRGFGCAIAGPIRGCPGDGRPKLALTRSCEASLGGRPRARAGERIPGPPARAPNEAVTRECRSRAASGVRPVCACLQYSRLLFGCRGERHRHRCRSHWRPRDGYLRGVADRALNALRTRACDCGLSHSRAP